jgi:hypothetical protein
MKENIDLNLRNTTKMNKVYVVERAEYDNFEDSLCIVGVFTTFELAREFISKEEAKKGKLLPDFTHWIHDFVLNEGPKDEHQ